MYLLLFETRTRVMSPLGMSGSSPALPSSVSKMAISVLASTFTPVMRNRPLREKYEYIMSHSAPSSKRCSPSAWL